MNFYFVMNANGLYLNSDRLWTGDWSKARKTLDPVSYDSKMIGVHDYFVVNAVDAFGTNAPRNTVRVKDIGVLTPQAIDTLTQAGLKVEDIKAVPDSDRVAFFRKVDALLKEYSRPVFQPSIEYSREKDELIIKFAEHTAILRGEMEDASTMRDAHMNVTGFVVQGVLQKITGADPSKAAVLLDLEFACILCEFYEVKFFQHNGAWTWKPEELNFFRTIQDVWPGLNYKFLRELT